MKKIMFLLIVFASCQKQSTCIRCESQNDVFEGCKGDEIHKDTDMAELARFLVNEGYECETYYD